MDACRPTRLRRVPIPAGPMSSVLGPGDFSNPGHIRQDGAPAPQQLAKGEDHVDRGACAPFPAHHEAPARLQALDQGATALLVIKAAAIMVETETSPRLCPGTCWLRSHGREPLVVSEPGPEHQAVSELQ